MDGKKDDEWGGWTDEKDGWKEESKKRKMNGWRKGERKISDQREKDGWKKKIDINFFMKCQSPVLCSQV